MKGVLGDFVQLFNKVRRHASDDGRGMSLRKSPERGAWYVWVKRSSGIVWSSSREGMRCDSKREDAGSSLNFLRY
jgi:hypothetical protein